MSEIIFEVTPHTHASENHHWDRAILKAGTSESILQFQNGPIKVHGVNGVQLTDVLKVCLARYKMLNKSFPCRENSLVITRLQEAILWDQERTSRRTEEGVEGYDKKIEEN